MSLLDDLKKLEADATVFEREFVWIADGLRWDRMRAIIEALEGAERLREALIEMVLQHAYGGVKDNEEILWTGGLSANERAFHALGWPDPTLASDPGAVPPLIRAALSTTGEEK